MKVLLIILGIVLVVAIVVVAGCRILTSRSTEATVALTAKLPGKVITCCNDGLRPVYFKLEATDEQAGPFLGRG